MTSPDPKSQRCALCQVEIQGDGAATDRVLFSRGTPGTRSKLWARVCQYLKTDEQKQQCINQDPGLRGSRCRVTDLRKSAPSSSERVAKLEFIKPRSQSGINPSDVVDALTHSV